MANRTAPSRSRAWSWRSQSFRGLVYQILAVALIGLGVWYLAHNTLVNMAARGMQTGFGFMQEAAGFDIGESVIRYDALDPYWKAFLVGLFNTLRVAVVGIVLATLLGTLIGIGRFSHNVIVRGLCQGYVELFRNVPLLLQLMVWYLICNELLPSPSEPMSLGEVGWLSKSGLFVPVPEWSLGHAFAGVGMVAGMIAVWFYRRWARRRFEATGRQRSMVLVPAIIVLVGTLAGWVMGGAPTAFSIPRPDGFAMEGGAAFTPEFLSLLAGLSLYSAAYISEVVRSGIASVSRGQLEAARSLGLSRRLAMRLVILPQALRVIIPPITSQYLSLTKNSSLAVAIGYPDVVSVANTTLNQSGRAVECIAIVMAIYLMISLSTSALMNWYNRRAAIVER